jgi:hypothetical protein
MRKQSY